MSKTKRKVITRTVVRKDLVKREQQYYYSLGARDAMHTVLHQHNQLIQLKDLCTEYETTFKIQHPNRAWHLERKSGKDVKEVNSTTPGNEGQAQVPSNPPHESSATPSPAPSDTEKVGEVAGSEERAQGSN